MSTNFADRLLEAIAAKRSPTVIALDPVLDRLPGSILEGRVAAGERVGREEAAGALWEYSWRVLRAIAPHVPAVKINSAYFERYHAEGVEVYHNLVGEARAQGLLVIGDVKRGDVGHTAEMYAAAHLADDADAGDATDDGEPAPDAITINGYFGLDGVQPFVNVAQAAGKGVFVLVRTSNPSAAAVQDVVTQDGRKLHEVVAAEVARWASDAAAVGTKGYSLIGAVTASREPEDAHRLREALPQSMLLVPGYGAQGGTARDYLPYFKSDGSGAVIAAGRSVIFAYKQPENLSKPAVDWETCVGQACEAFVADVRQAVGLDAA